MVYYYDKTTNFKLDREKIEEIVVDRPSSLNLVLSELAMEFKIYFELNAEYNKSKIELFSFCSEETAEKAYEKMSNSIKSGEYKLKLYSNGKIELKLNSELEKELDEMYEKDYNEMLERLLKIFEKFPNDFKSSLKL